MADAVKTAATTARSRTFVATVVAVTSADGVEQTAAALERLRHRAAVRTLLVSLGDARQPEVVTNDAASTILGLVPRYLNNAVAAARLSSLPTLVWWRGGDVATLEQLARLADRILLDVEDPLDYWRAVPALAPQAAISDLRWTRLTRWRNLLAQFFDVSSVRASAGTFTTLDVRGRDAHAARLVAGWIASSLPGGSHIKTTMSPAAAAPIESIALTAPGAHLRLELLPTGTCIASTLGGGDRPSAARVVPAGDQGEAALLAEELRVRARDMAFERAVREVVTR